MRTPEEIRQHYEAEKDLADRLRRARPEERQQLYGQVYDELFRRVPHHPQLTRKQDDAARDAAVAERMALLGRFLRPETVFLEIGAGDCSLSRHVAAKVRTCYALDVSQEIVSKASAPNMEMVLSDGCSVPVPDETVTVAYSYQLMEHIHPDDAVLQLRNILRALAPNGVYLCVTPNRLNGPHDISRYFDRVATGFHLREYTVTELNKLFRSLGFRRVEAYVGVRRRYVKVPLFGLAAVETVMAWLPHRIRQRLGNSRGFSNLLFVSVVATK